MLNFLLYWLNTVCKTTWYVVHCYISISDSVSLYLDKITSGIALSGPHQIMTWAYNYKVSLMWTVHEINKHVSSIFFSAMQLLVKLSTTNKSFYFINSPELISLVVGAWLEIRGQHTDSWSHAPMHHPDSLHLSGINHSK